MKEFVHKHEDRIHGVLSCFDRMLFRGDLPIMSGCSMAQFLKSHAIDSASVKPFLLSNAERVKGHAVAMARKHGRPFEYLGTKLRRQDAALKVAERDSITEGLVCIFSAVEPCRTFSLRFTTGQPYVHSAKRKCLHLYYYFMDRDLGLIHVRVQTWFPLQIQVYLNGHEWLAHKLSARGIEHTKLDNVFARIEDLPRAQRLADRFAHLKWPQILKLGAWILAVGWFGFNVMSAQTVDKISGLVAVNLLMAMAGGTLVATLMGRNDPGFACNGPLAGLVAVCAGSDVMHPAGALVVGGIAGRVFVAMFTLTQNRWKIDDVLGVWPLHGLCGAWGGIACGIFGLPALGGLGGVSLSAQFIGTLMGVAGASAAGLVVYGVLKAIMGLRLSAEEEFEGADLSIHKIGSTPDREVSW